MIKIKAVKWLSLHNIYSFLFLQIRQLPNSFDDLPSLQNLQLGNYKTFYNFIHPSGSALLFLLFTVSLTVCTSYPLKFSWT